VKTFQAKALISLTRTTRFQPNPRSRARGRRLAQERHHRVADAHGGRVIRDRLVDPVLFVDLDGFRETRAALALLQHGRDLMDADERRRADEPLDAAGEHEPTGGSARGAADDRLAARIGAGDGPLGAVGEKRAGGRRTRPDGPFG